MTELSTLDPSELGLVLGGLSLKELGRSALSGFLDGGSQGVKSGQGFLTSALRGGIMGLAQGFAGQIGTGGEQPAGPPQQAQPQPQ